MYEYKARVTRVVDGDSFWAEVSMMYFICNRRRYHNDRKGTYPRDVCRN